jgi:hypothetical protein
MKRGEFIYKEGDVAPALRYMRSVCRPAAPAHICTVYQDNPRSLTNGIVKVGGELP